jgi:alanine dehydrogenase
MQVGVPKEIKASELRVGLTPASVRELVSAGHDVLVEVRQAAASDLRTPTTSAPAYTLRLARNRCSPAPN